MKIIVFEAFSVNDGAIFAIADPGAEIFSCGEESTAVFDYDASGLVFQVELLHLQVDWPNLIEFLVGESSSKGALRVTFEEHLVFLQMLYHDELVVEGTVAATYAVLYNKKGSPIGLKFYEFNETHGPLSNLNLFGVLPFQIEPLIKKFL